MKKISNNVAMEIYGSLNIFKMVAKVVKNTKIATYLDQIQPQRWEINYFT